MDPAYALSLQNFIAAPRGCKPRKGYRKWSTGFTTPVTTLLPYNSKVASNSKLFAVSGSEIFDITNGGAIGSPVVTGLSAGANAYWQHATQTYSTSSSNYLIAVNGVDSPRLFDGTSWSACSQVATPSGPGQFSQNDNNGSTVNITAFIDVVLHQQRLWFVASNSSKAFYTSIASVGGQLNAFDFGPLFTRGGALHKLETWTMDTGGVAGTQSMLVAISTKGDVVIFAGNDPAVATSWGLVGQFQLGSPVGRRCTVQYQGDLLVLSMDGLFPLSKYLQSARLERTAALTYAIAPTISELTSTLGTIKGFELVVYPSENVVLLNIPQLIQDNNFQFCYETNARAWSQFKGWPAACFGTFNDALYFGAEDHVALAFIGWQDGADINGTGGNNIVANALTAFDSMATPEIPAGSIKQVVLVRPFFQTGQTNPTVSIGINTDFNLGTVVGAASLNASSSATWDIATWDSYWVVWGGTLVPYNQWSTPACYPGEYLAFAISMSVTSDTLWPATSWTISPGGQFG
jgi:hypothetical protein